ncbi:hypothetical protein D3C78_1007610 [compost metagenome]
MGNVVEQRQLLRRRRLRSALLGLDLLPAPLDRRLIELGQIRRAIQVAVGKYVGMATDQLGGDAVDHRGEVEAALLAAQLAVVDHLEQQVAELARQVGEVAALDGVGHLVGLLEGMRDDARIVLLEVPRAAVLRVAQASHQVQQVVQLVRRHLRLPSGCAALR